MNLTELTLPHLVAAAVGLFFLRALVLKLHDVWRRWRARKHLKRYQADRDAYYGSSASAPRNSATRHNHNYIYPEELKDQDTKVHDMTQPKGFWTRLIMGEKMNLIREMIRISNSAEHKGYWQDRVEAQKRVEGQRQVGDEGQGR